MYPTRDQDLVTLAKNTYFALAKVYLRPFRLSDLADYHAFTSDAEALKYNYPAHQSLAESLVALVKWNLAEPLGRYAIVDNQTQRVIGNFHLTLASEEATAVIGYTLQRNYWRQGIATNCVQHMIQFCFEQLTIQKIVAFVHPQNLASIAVLEKNGFTSMGMKDHRKIYELSK